MSDSNEKLIVIGARGTTHRFSTADMPVSIGGRADSDVFVDGTPSEVQIGLLDGAYFVQSGKQSSNVEINGVSLRGSQRIDDGDEVVIDGARLVCRHGGGLLRVTVRAAAAVSAAVRADESSAADDSSVDEGIAIKPISFRDLNKESVHKSIFTFSPTSIATAIAFLVLALLGWFAFTAKSVEFVFEDQANQVSLPSTLFKFRMGDRYMLRAGRHRIRAELDGYYSLNTEVAVGSAASQSVALNFVKLPGIVSITSEPAQDVSVSIDGRPVGSAPIEDFELVPGEHELVFSNDRYFPETLAVNIEGGLVRQDFNVVLRQNWAPVDLVTEPVGADVLVDDAVFGQAPLSLELVEGDYSLEVRLPGYNAWRESLAVVAGEPQSLPPIILEEADGRVRLVSNTPNVAVSVNGEYEGTTPLNLRLRPGRVHTIVATKPGFEAATTELSIAADSGRTVSLELRELFGDVSISSEPENAEVWIDGELADNTPANLSLSAVPHEIEIRLDGYAIKSQDLTPRAGFAQTLDFLLEPLNSLTGDGYERVVRTSLGQELRVLPAGEFTMGSSRREQGRRSNEILRPVKVTKAFYLGTTEVTNAQFRAFRPEHDSGAIMEHSLNDDSQPVVNVSWQDVAQYLNWLSIRDGLQPVYQEGPNGWVAVVPFRSGYRLPTEAEWAWAARFHAQESPLVFPWSADPAAVSPPDRTGNYADIAAANLLPTSLYTYNDDFVVTAPVASFSVDRGFYDLGGNVAEWVHDFYSLDLVAAQAQTEDPLGPESGVYHVVRGSSWRSATLTDLRIASRNYSGNARDDLGFRIARNLN